MSYFPYPHTEGTDVTYPFKHLLDASDKNFKLKTPNLKKPNLKNVFKNDQPLIKPATQTVKTAHKNMNIREMIGFKYELLEIIKRFQRQISEFDKSKNLQQGIIESKIKKIQVQINLLDRIIEEYEKLE